MTEQEARAVAGPTGLRPLSPIRRVVARKMSEAWRTIPTVTIHRAVAFDGLLAARARIAESGRKPAIDTLLARYVGSTLAEHELLNGSWVEEERAVLVHAERNVAIAVDTPLGLSAVVLRGADQRSVEELDNDLREMVQRARDGRSLANDVQGATFTITNLGGLGVELFNPIITPPQSAVLGIGAMRGGPDGTSVATLSLSFDHRVADGADAARMLASLVARIVSGD